MISGNLEKMTIQPDNEANYWLCLGSEKINLNQHINKTIELSFNGKINCIHCGTVTKKSYSQGYCYPCSIKLAACDMCILQPERCHYEQGTCREPEWALQHCFQPHYVYLANSSGLKVGITRCTQTPTRWLDQGATQALPIYRVANRYISGLLEDALKSHVSDKTDWRKMLKSDAEPLDLMHIRDELYQKNTEAEQSVIQKWGTDALIRMDDTNTETSTFTYPVRQYPSKVTSLSFDKTPEITGKLQGIKGQYLILDSGVLNLRKHTGYFVAFNCLT